jgi:hypothetical protein
VIKDDQPDAREGQAGRAGVAERPVVPKKPGNAGAGSSIPAVGNTRRDRLSWGKDDHPSASPAWCPMTPSRHSGQWRDRDQSAAANPTDRRRKSTDRDVNELLFATSEFFYVGKSIEKLAFWSRVSWWISLCDSLRLGPWTTVGGSQTSTHLKVQTPFRRVSGVAQPPGATRLVLRRIQMIQHRHPVVGLHEGF